MGGTVHQRVWLGFGVRKNGGVPSGQNETRTFRTTNLKQRKREHILHLRSASLGNRLRRNLHAGGLMGSALETIRPKGINKGSRMGQREKSAMQSQNSPQLIIQGEGP